jgi:hypothetical protein
MDKNYIVVAHVTESKLEKLMEFLKKEGIDFEHPDPVKDE